MRRANDIVTFVALVISVGAFGADAERARAIQSEIAQMVQVDQEVRERYGAHLRSEPLVPNNPSPRFLALIEEMARIDASNVARLDAIVAEVGWPSTANIGEGASQGAWLIVQHAELPVQERYLPVIAAATSAGYVKPADFATLEDRVLQRQGSPQKYGTQVVTATDGTWTVYLVEDAANLDSRRKSVGLRPMNDYLQQLEQFLGQKVNRDALGRPK